MMLYADFLSVTQVVQCISTDFTHFSVSLYKLLNKTRLVELYFSSEQRSFG